MLGEGAGVGLFPWTVPSARCCHSPGVNPTTEETDFFGDTPWKNGGRERSFENGSDALYIYFCFSFFFIMVMFLVTPATNARFPKRQDPLPKHITSKCEARRGNFEMRSCSVNFFQLFSFAFVRR